jgi:glutathione S-transferase
MQKPQVSEVQSQTAPAELAIYHIEGRRSFRVVWLCEELGLPYRLVFREGDVRGSLIDIRKAYPPMPLCPLISLDGVWLLESGAILDVLAARYGAGRLAPEPSSPDYLCHAQWMHFAEGTLLARMVQYRLSSDARGLNVRNLDSYKPGDKPETLNLIGQAAIFGFVDSFLGSNLYFGGAAFSTADIMMHWSIQLSKLMVGLDLDHYPNINRWMTAVEGRPAFVRAIAASLPSGADEFGMPIGQPAHMKPPPALTDG